MYQAATGRQGAVVELDRVGRVQPVAGPDVCRKDVAPRLASLPAPEVGPLDVLHRDVHPAVVSPRIVDADDVVVGEAGEDVRLAEQAPAIGVVVLRERADQLDGVVALEVRVPAEVDVAHRAPADPAQDDVLPDPRRALVTEQAPMDAVDDEAAFEVGRHGRRHG
ncbi:hypothetical protein OV203_08825 [Nannocystis sp. ILAH1]|uniref:hypothetical protein n=1 Tax=Nannocystis sp. ILAH1 TaxID=2996789 RepID=UPI002271C76C|nr:hypothetical protein [Nannocystis sp. ILAH1]MCY0987224.1 hypothetical protein [Nannocystis sp. ILAH1]